MRCNVVCALTRWPSPIALVCLALPLSADPVFERRNSEISHAYTGGWEHFVGGGVAVFDCNADGLPEAFVAGGARPAVLLRNTTSARGADLQFAPNTPDSLSLTGVTGAYPMDLDNDAVTDLVVLRVGENILLRGTGACQFEPFAEMGGERWTTAFSATWEAGAERPTLAFGNYVDRSNPEGPFEACDDNQVFKPIENGFEETVLSPGFCALSALFSDWDLQGRADLRLSNDRHYYVRGGAEQLWAMEARPRLYDQADGWNDHQLWGMGIASRDITGDGLPEIYLTSMGDQHLHLRTGAPGPSFRNAPFSLGHSAHRPHTGRMDGPRPGGMPNGAMWTMMGWTICSLPKAMSSRCPGWRWKIPTRCCASGPKVGLKKSLSRPELQHWTEAGVRALWI